MAAPVLIKPIPNIVINELAAYGPFNFKTFIKVEEKDEVKFSASLKDGQSLPQGLICTENGFLTGIPAKKTAGTYSAIVSAENSEGVIHVDFELTIKPAPVRTDQSYIDQLKTQVWDALQNNLPAPQIQELYNLPITPIEIYYLLERWGTLTFWDAFSLEPPGDKKELTIEGASPHYHVYDRGSCITVAPKDLFSYERTLEDALRTVRAVAREIYKRNWTLELVGFDKFMRAAWLEIQHLNDQYGKRLEVINFQPSLDDVRMYNEQVMNRPGMDF